MYDKELALEILTQIYQATQTVLKRFEPISPTTKPKMIPLMYEFFSFCVKYTPNGSFSESIKSVQ